MDPQTLLKTRLESSGPIVLTLGASQNGLAQERQSQFVTIAGIVFGLLGATFATVGGLAIGELVKGKSPEGAVGVLFLVMGLFLLSIGYGFMGWCHTLVLNPADQTWTREVGIRPRSLKASGSYSDQLSLRFGPEKITVKGKTRMIWRTRVVWKDKDQPPFPIALLERDGAQFSSQEALAQAREFAAHVGLKLITR